MEGQTEAQEKERLAQGPWLESDEPGLDSPMQAPWHLCAGFTPSLLLLWSYGDISLGLLVFQADVGWS